MRLIASIACWCALLLASEANAALPQPVARAFLAERIPLSAVGAYVQEIGATKPLFTQQPGKAMNPASTMKLVTTFAALELLGPNYQWITEAYADGPIADGVLDGNLVLKGRGDPKITVEQFNDFVAHIRATGLSSIRGDLVLDRTWFDPGPYDPGAFDGEPLRPYNVGPDALAVNFKSVRFIFAPNAAGDGVDVRVDPPIGRVTVQGSPRLVPGDCGDWHATLQADFADRGDSAQAVFRGRYAQACGEREWYVALLDHPHYMLNLFARTWTDSGGTFAGTVRDGRDATLRDTHRDARIGAASRRGSRHQQAVEQSHGAAAFPDARNDSVSSPGHDCTCGTRGRAVARPAQAAVSRSGNAERLGPVAEGAHRSAEHGAPAARRGCEQRAFRIHKLAGRRRDRRYREQAFH